jgi:hypothetical protein
MPNLTSDRPIAVSKFYYDIGYLSNLLTVMGLLGAAAYTLQHKWKFSGMAPM